MKIMLIDPIPTDIATKYLGDHIVYRPDLGQKSASILFAALSVSAIEAVITHTGTRFPETGIRLPSFVTDMVILNIDEENASTYDDGGCQKNDHVMTNVYSSNIADAYKYSLEMLERRSIERIVYDNSSPSINKVIGGKDVVIIGAGLVNLVTAFRLAEEGYKICVYDASPDPLKEAPWTSFGCSRGGDDARMFTLSEMDNYNDRTPSETMNTLFNRDVLSFGWGATKLGTLSSEELSWISDFETLPIWLADKYNDDIFSFSRNSRLSWEKWIQNDPELFRKCEIRSDILRVYSHSDQFLKAVERQNRIGATIRLLSPSAVAEYQPALRDAVSNGMIAGGIVVVGFTLNAHKFIACLITKMQSIGVNFEWNQRARRICKSGDGLIEGVTFDQRMVTASNYVISPGAYAQNLLDGTKSEGRIHGVLGAWLRLPNLVPRLDKSLKLARKGHITEDANITVATDAQGKPIIIIGSGYGHTGVDPFNIDKDLLRKMYDALIDTARLYFPDAYRVANDLGSIEESLKYCVRPWTANGLGIFEMNATAAGGRFIVTGGHNTGGFAQSPTIADAVLDGLEGRRHPMHSLYHPDRSNTFLGRTHSRRLLPQSIMPLMKQVQQSQFSQNNSAGHQRTEFIYPGT